MQNEQYKSLVSEMESLKRKSADLSRENEELKFENQRLSKTGMSRTSFDDSVAHKINELEYKLACAEKENVEFRKKIAKLQDTESRFDVLANESERLHNVVAEKQKEIDVLKAEKMELAHQNKSSIVEKNREIEELNSRLRDLEPLPKKLTEVENNYQRAIREITNENEHLSLALKGKDKEIENLRRSIKQMEKEKCLDPVEHDQILQKNREIDILKAELSTLKSKTASFNEEFSNLVAANKAKEKEIEHLQRIVQRTSLESKKSMDIEHHQESKLEKDVERLSKLLDEKQKEVEELRKKNTDYSVRLHASYSFETENQKLTSKVKELEDSNIGLKKNLDYMTKSVHKLNEQLHLKEQEILDLQLDKSQLNHEIKLLKQEFTEAIKTSNKEKDFLIGELQDTVDKLTKEIDVLVQNADRQRQERQKLIHEKDNLMKSVSGRDEQIRKLEIEIAKLKTKLNEIVPKAEYLEKEDHTLADKLKEEEEENRIFRIRITELERFRAGFEDLKKQLENVISEKEGLEQTHETADEQLSYLKETFGKLESDLQAKKIEITNLLQENKFLRSDIETLEKKLREDANTIDHLKSELEKTKASGSFIHERDQLLAQLKKLEYEHRFVSEERDYLLTTIRERSDQVIQNEEALRKANAELEKTKAQVQSLEQELQDLGSLLTSKQRENRGLENGLAELEWTRKELDRTKNLLNEAKREKDILEKHIAERDKHIEDLKLKISQISSEIHIEKDLLDVETEPLRAENERLKQELELSRIEANRLLEKVIQEKDQLAKLIDDRDRHIADLKLKVSQISTEVSLEKDRIQTETEPLEEEVQRVKQELELSRIEANKLLEKTMQEKDEMVQIIRAQEKHIEDLKLKVRHVSSEVSLEKDQANAETKQLQTEIQRLKEEIEKHKKTLEQKEKQINALASDFAKVLHDNKELIKIIEDLEKRHESVTQTLQQRESEMKKFEGLVDKSFPELQNLRDAVQSQSDEINKLTRLNLDQERELVELRAKMQRFAELEKTVQELSIRNGQLLEQLQSSRGAKADMAEMENNVDDLIEKRDKLISVLSEKEAELKKLRPVIEENELLRSQLKHATQTKEDLFNENEQLMRDNKYLRESCQDLKRELNKLSDKYKALEEVSLEFKSGSRKFEEPHEKKVRGEPKVRILI